MAIYLAAAWLLRLSTGYAQTGNDPSDSIAATCRELNRARIQFQGASQAEIESYTHDIQDACTTVNNALSDSTQLSSLRQKTKQKGANAQGKYGLGSGSASFNMSESDVASDDAFKSRIQSEYQNSCSRNENTSQLRQQMSGRQVTYFDNTPMVKECLDLLRTAPVIVSVQYSGPDATLQLTARDGATNPTLTLSYNRNEIACTDNAGTDMFSESYCAAGTGGVAKKVGGCRLRIGSDGQTVACRLRDNKLQGRAVIVSYGKYQTKVTMPSEIIQPAPINSDIIDLRNRVENLQNSNAIQNMRWDLVSAFSVANKNPNGVWTYGWASNDYTSFNPYIASTTTPNPTWLAGIGVDKTPSVFLNSGSTVIYGVAPGQVALHPGPSQQPSVVRWTNPSQKSGGRLTIYGSFFPGDSGIMRVQVRINGNTAWTASDGGSFTLTQQASSVSTVDFAVDNGYTCGSTPLVATIERTE